MLSNTRETNKSTNKSVNQTSVNNPLIFSTESDYKTDETHSNPYKMKTDLNAQNLMIGWHNILNTFECF